jgi:hypothetical protein
MWKCLIGLVFFFTVQNSIPKHVKLEAEKSGTHPQFGMKYVRGYEPPTAYRMWWNEMEQCSKVTKKSFNKIRWYEVQAYNFDMVGLEEISWLLGYAHIDGNEIYVAFARTTDEMIIKHEMLHILTGPGHRDYPYKVCHIPTQQ